jgi:hypothetical protein
LLTLEQADYSQMYKPMGVVVGELRAEEEKEEEKKVVVV